MGERILQRHVKLGRALPSQEFQLFCGVKSADRASGGRMGEWRKSNYWKGRGKGSSGHWLNTQSDWLGQWFSNSSMHQNHAYSNRVLGPTPQASESEGLGGAQEVACLTRCQVTWMLPIPESCFKKHWPWPLAYLEFLAWILNFFQAHTFSMTSPLLASPSIQVTSCGHIISTFHIVLRMSFKVFPLLPGVHQMLYPSHGEDLL